MRSSRRSQRGAALVEFAFVAIAFYLLIAGTIEIGRMVFSSQALQNAARVGARELAMFPLPATATFKEALNDPDVRERVFDSRLMVLDVTNMADVTLQAQLDNWPVLNRMLIPLMIREQVTVDGAGYDLLRYPGALLKNPGYQAPPTFDANRFNVGIPRVVSRDTDGTETIEWLPVVEEVVPSNLAAEAPFSLASTGRQRGLVALRINFPFQAATMSGYLNSDPAHPVEAHDAAVTAINSPPGNAPLAFPTTATGTYSGQYGLGLQYAVSKQVRPFRRLLSAQSMFRREVFTR